MPLTVNKYCPCGSGKYPVDCCTTLILHGAQAQTAEQLMRSRYTAHVMLAVDYLWRTWSPTVRQHSSPEAIAAWASSCEWLGLDILACERGGIEDNEGTVTFCAHYRREGQKQQHLEKSLFKREAGLWRYIDHIT
ncbi:YchJ family protein [Gilvimarinus polysaccharolyticus]|uniref:YchJ family protein n=1 Tax=Gilvimarinus polysaccharolyticus TaxID=863921 RepID=UPI000673641F|nr:YchJ family metal-binding protein [Gilvimarinus polysaccharolyticus]